MNRNTLAGGHMEHKRSPLRACVCCLYSIGLGVGKIAAIVPHRKSTCFKWVRQHGILDPSRAKRGSTKGCKSRKAKPPIDWQKLIMLEYAKDLKACIKADAFWLNHPARAAYWHVQNYPRMAEVQKARARAQWAAKKHNPDWRAKRASIHKEWRKNNRLQNLDYDKQWRLSNPERWKACTKRARKKQNQNPQYRMRHNLRGRIREFMRNGAHKQSATKLLGCGREQLMRWIEAKFTKGMEWNNYSQWQVDHIIPCAKFDLTNPEQQRRCFHYTNLQPLWAAENLLKADTIQPTQPELCMSLI